MPTKVCPNCSVMSDTEAENCPNCGASYQRQARRPLSRVEVAAIAATVVAVLGAAAAFALSSGDDGTPKADVKPTATPGPTGPPPHSIRFSQVAALRAHTPYREVVASLGPPRPDLQGTQKRYFGANRCIYYDLSDQPQTDAQICFRHGKVTVVAVNYPHAPKQTKPNAKHAKPGDKTAKE